jgi:OOP family OmpA-OmpF porin
MVLWGVVGIALAGAVAVTGCASRRAVTGLEAKLEQRLAGLDERLGRLEGEVGGHGDRLGRLEARTRELVAGADEAGRRAEAAAAAAGEAAARADQARQAAAEAQARAERAGEAALARADAAGTRPGRAPGGAFAETVVDTATVRFAFDRWDLDDRAQTALGEVLGRLDGRNGLVLILEGYTDAVGSDGYNFELSRKRAEAVRRFMVDRGVTLRRIEFIGFGETHPAKDNATPAGRAENRRVHIKLIATE